jgi:prevent-host-death family protein
MTTLTMPSVEAQNNFGKLLDSAQRQIVSVTRRGRQVALVMSPEVLQDHIDAQLALQAQTEGFVSQAETQQFVNSLRDA